MPLSNFEHIKRYFTRMEDEEERTALFREILLMTLARATRADAVTDAKEVEAVQRVIKQYTGETVPADEIRVAASSELYEKAPIDRYLRKVGQRVGVAERQAIVRALIEIFSADYRISEFEVDFFNRVSDALNLSPAEIVGLNAS